MPPALTPEREFRAEARWVRSAPRKAQLVVSEIRGRPATDAVTVLRFMTRAAARDVEKVLNSAIANAESHPTDSYAADQLYVSAAYVGSGPTLKRWQARARGRVGRIKKRTCHITIRLAPIEGAQRPRAAEEAEKPKRARRPRAEQPAAAEAAVTATEAAVTEVEAAEADGVEVEAAAEEATAETKPARASRRKVAETAEAAETEAAKPVRSRKAASAPEPEPAPEPVVGESDDAEPEAAESEAAAPEAAEQPEAAEKPKRAPRRKQTKEGES